MKENIHLINNVSLGSFVLSSLCLAGASVIYRDGRLTTNVLCTAALFWLALLFGIAMQIWAFMMCRKLGHRGGAKKARKFLIPVIIFAVTSIFLLIFRVRSIILASTDLALLLLSTEIYFYFKRRYSI